MKYVGKYKKMAEDFRKDGADEHLVEKFIREEMERDEFRKERGTTDLNAYRRFLSKSKNFKVTFWMKLYGDMSL